MDPLVDSDTSVRSRGVCTPLCVVMHCAKKPRVLLQQSKLTAALQLVERQLCVSACQSAALQLVAVALHQKFVFTATMRRHPSSQRCGDLH